MLSPVDILLILLFIALLVILFISLNKTSYPSSNITKPTNTNANTNTTNNVRFMAVSPTNTCVVQPGTVLVKITNNCGKDIAIGGVDNGNTFQFGVIPPTNDIPTMKATSSSFLKQGESSCVNIPNNWIAGRIFVFYDVHPSTQTINNPYYSYDKVELTINPPRGSNVLPQVNFNLTAVDYIAIPARIEAFNNGNLVGKTSYNRSRKTTLAGCPTKVDSYGRCVSSNTYCTNPMFTSPTISQAGQNVPNPNYDPKTISYCSALNNQQQGINTINIYGCSGPLGSSPQLCADLNRGVPIGSSDTNPANYYKNLPFNKYSAYIHGNNKYKIYAFPYDDYANQSGFQSVSANELNITFCPLG